MSIKLVGVKFNCRIKQDKLKFQPLKRLAMINSEDAVLGTWTKNSTLNLLCKNANGCDADYITELSTSSIVLFSKITDEFVILEIGF